VADKKISALTGATTPLVGTEVLPIVQGGSTVKVAVSDLTAGRAVATAGGSFTDNITQSTAAKGVNFTANTAAAGMTSRLLNWYEEGTWTIGLTFGGGSTGLTISQQDAFYTRAGRLVHVSGRFSLSAKGSSTGAAAITSLPFTIKNSNGSRAGGFAAWYANMAGVNGITLLGDNNTTIASFFYSGATGVTALTDTNFTDTSAMYFSYTYIV